MPSFDVVSEIDKVQIRNAVDNASRELETRFDFRGVDASFQLNENNVLLTAEAEFQLTQLKDILRNKCAKQQIDTNCMDSKSVERSGKYFKQTVEFKEGIDQPTAKKLVKLIKDAKLKVQTQVQGEELRITGKKRDDLQAVMALIREANLGQPFQFKNFRD